MGLDTVELVMEFEDTFDVTIPDIETEQLTTPGAVADWLVARLIPPERPPAACASARAFYTLRADLASTYGVSRDAVRPGARIGELVPKGQRHGWPAFARRNRLPRPPFRLFGERFGDPAATLADLSRHAARLDPAGWYDLDGRPDRAAILNTVRRITAEQTGLTLDGVREESHFIYDLNMD